MGSSCEGTVRMCLTLSSRSRVYNKCVERGGGDASPTISRTRVYLKKGWNGYSKLESRALKERKNRYVNRRGNRSME